MTKQRLFKKFNLVDNTQIDDVLVPQFVPLEPSRVFKRPVPLPPLTEAWFRCAVTPRFLDDGTAMYALTPPRNKDSTAGAWLRVGFIVALCFSAFWGIARLWI